MPRSTGLGVRDRRRSGRDLYFIQCFYEANFIIVIINMQDVYVSCGQFHCNLDTITSMVYCNVLPYIKTSQFGMFYIVVAASQSSHFHDFSLFPFPFFFLFFFFFVPPSSGQIAKWANTMANSYQTYNVGSCPGSHKCNIHVSANTANEYTALSPLYRSSTRTIWLKITYFFDYVMIYRLHSTSTTCAAVAIIEYTTYIYIYIIYTFSSTLETASNIASRGLFLEEALFVWDLAGLVCTQTVDV